MRVLLSFLLFFLTLNLLGQCDRQVAVDDYNNVYLNTSFNVADMNWTGSIANCNAGTISQSVQDKVIDRINYFRRMCDLDDNTVLVPALNNGAQQQGNLAWGSWNWFNPITMYMEDSGAGNVAVGHRRWILYSGGEEFGNGMTPNRETLYVINNFGNPPNNNKPYIAYPPDGHIPAPLVFPRWSFGMRGAAFLNATVTMTDQNGNNIPLNVVYNASVGFGDVSIVWEPTGIDTTNPEDVVYTVTVSGITGVSPSSYTYETKIIQPVHPPACPAGTAWEEASCACVTPPSGCDPDLVINDDPIASNTYQAQNTITSAGKVPNGNDVTFKAGSFIDLQPDFEVEGGADFQALIEACPPGQMVVNDNLLFKSKANLLTALKEGEICVMGEAIAVGQEAKEASDFWSRFFKGSKEHKSPPCPRF